MELLSLDRPGRLTDATRGNKKNGETQAHGYVHTIYTHTYTCSETKMIQPKWNTFTYTMPARARR